MKSAFQFMTLAAFFLITASTALAGKDDKRSDKKSELSNLVLTGTVASEQVEKKSKDGGSRTVTVYYLTSTDGKVFLPQAHSKKKGEPAAYNLANFVGRAVRVTAKGISAPNKKGGKYIHVKHITAIETTGDSI